MNVSQFNPLTDPRWDEFVVQHPESSIFHTSAWLRALQQTYGYEPVAFTTTRPGIPLQDALVFCWVQSWLTGSRLVSLPFSDHCQPLVDGSESSVAILSFLQSMRPHKRWNYVEIRPLRFDPPDGLGQDYKIAESYVWQALDLHPEIPQIVRGFHKSCIQRKIHRAEREHLRYEEGRSPDLLQKFYRLSILTRRRHGLPPQPMAWFQNLVEALGPALCVRVASQGEEPLAAIITLRHKDSLVYKYGCSNEQFHNLGGMAFVFWHAIQDGKRTGALQFDLGRSDSENDGLVSYKAKWGAATQPLHYYRVSTEVPSRTRSEWAFRLARDLCSRMPESLLTAAGRVLYRHLG
jgi:CelD/BcsL family acetyltransferase involved in cellulose biosynthesis